MQRSVCHRRWQRKVKERLRRATRELDLAGVLYAVAGGNAVAEWVAWVDEDAVRKTRDVDILIRRRDFPAARPASRRPALFITSFSTSIPSSRGRKANQAVESASTPVRKLDRTTMARRYRAFFFQYGAAPGLSLFQAGAGPLAIVINPSAAMRSTLAMLTKSIFSHSSSAPW
jgi:hypothetical protein